jgi:hypothetical protein
MTAKTDNKQPELSRLDRPSVSVPSIDRPWEDPSERKSRQAVTNRDLSQHRVYHSLYEDMLN